MALKEMTLDAVGKYPVDGLPGGIEIPVLMFRSRNDRVLRFSWSIERFIEE
jgi:hypothetical protein